MIENGEFIPKWKHEYEINKLNNEIVDSRDRGTLDNLTVFVNNEKYKII